MPCRPFFKGGGGGGGTRIRLGCVKQEGKLERGMGTGGESGKYESIFFRTLFRSVPYATHHTFFSS